MYFIYKKEVRDFLTVSQIYHILLKINPFKPLLQSFDNILLELLSNLTVNLINTVILSWIHEKEF